jgi:ankyrin repeat protein
MVLEETVREALGTLPAELKNVYDIICAQIESSRDMNKRLAENTMSWLLCATKPLSCDEMIKAITAGSMSPPSAITKEDVLSICCNFVKTDDEMGVFQFVHLSVREYLESRFENDASQGHAAIAQSCLQACLSNMKPRRRANLNNPQTKTFYDYAHVYWPLHCQKAKDYRTQDPLKTSFRAFLCSGSRPTQQFFDWTKRWRNSWQHIMDLQNRGAEYDLYEKLTNCVHKGESGNTIFVACVYGFLEVIEDRRQAGMGYEDSKARNSAGRDPYEVAVRYGQEDVINLLRSTTTGLDSVAAKESTLLSAISVGEMLVVKKLLNDHSELMVTDNIIISAAEICNITMMKFLVNEHPDFMVTEQLLMLAGLNLWDGLAIVQFLFEEGGNDLENFDLTGILKSACFNPCWGLSIINFILERVDGIHLDEEVFEAAAMNWEGVKILKALFRSSTGVQITEDIVEAAAQNANVEPLRYLFSSFPQLPVTWSVLNAAARNDCCGDKILEAVLENLDESCIDEDLMLASMTNQTLATQLLEMLLIKVPSSALITEDILLAAARNRFHGERLIGLLLKHAPHILLRPIIIEAASRNPYCAPEILRQLLLHDRSALVSTTALQNAARNNECGAEALQILLEQISGNPPVTQIPPSPIPLGQTHAPSLVISSDVVEAAASNDDSGVETMSLLLKWYPELQVSSKAVENAAENTYCGGELIKLWTAQKKCFVVSLKAIQKAAYNARTGMVVLNLLLRHDKELRISDEEIAVAASNPRLGFDMVRTLHKRWNSGDDFEKIISSAARNAHWGSQIITYLLNRRKGTITADIIESCASSPFASRDMMTLLLKAVPDLKPGMEIVEAASEHPQHFFDNLEVLRGGNSGVRITDAAIFNLTHASRNIIETIQQLSKYHDGFTITEGLLKSIVQNPNANEGTINYLYTFQKVQYPVVGSLPVTEEVLAAAFQNPGNGAASMVKVLLNLIAKRDENPEVYRKRLEIVVESSWPSALMPILQKHAEERGVEIPVSHKALCKAASALPMPQVLRTLLNWLPARDRYLAISQDVIAGAFEDQSDNSSLRLLMAYARQHNLPLMIGNDLFAKAIHSGPSTTRLIFKFWAEQDPSEPLHNHVSQNVLEAAAVNLRARGLVSPSEISNFHFLFRMLVDKGIEVSITSTILEKAHTRAFDDEDCEFVLYYLSRISRIQNRPLDFGTLIVPCVLKMAIRPHHSGRPMAKLLSFVSKDKKDQLLSRELLLAAAGNGSTAALEYLLKQKDFHQDAEYYMKICQFSKASRSSNAVAEQRSLLKKGVFPNARESWMATKQGNTPLMKAASHNMLASVRTFMRFREAFDLDIVDYNGQTALHYACHRGYETVVQLLLENGANRSIKDSEQKTAEECAFENCHYNVAKMVREFEATKVGNGKGASGS